jgi:serine/threonine protein kinase
MFTANTIEEKMSEVCKFTDFRDIVNLNTLSEEFYSFVDACLTKDVAARPDARALLNHPFVRDLQPSGGHSVLIQSKIASQPQGADSGLSLTYADAYNIWRLGGGTFDTDFQEMGLLDRPSIRKLPISVPIMSNFDDVFPQLERGPNFTRSFRIASVIDIYKSWEVLSDTPTTYDVDETLPSWSEEYLELLWLERDINKVRGSKTTLATRERDPYYQHARVKLFRNLLQQYPLSKDKLVQKARKDIPPVSFGALRCLNLNFNKLLEIARKSMGSSSGRSRRPKYSLPIDR